MVEQSAVNRLVVGSSPTCRVLESIEGKFWVYVLQNTAGKFYVGSTGNPQRRLERHNSVLGLPTFTRKNGPWKLVRQ
jgi:predicted GIY-YIG superfamily endonuclease